MPGLFKRPAVEQCAPVPAKVRFRLTTPGPRQPRLTSVTVVWLRRNTAKRFGKSDLLVDVAIEMPRLNW